VPAYYTIKKSILNLLANGRSSGLVIESSAFNTSVTPVSEGYSLSKLFKNINFGGEHITKYCLETLKTQTESKTLKTEVDLKIDVNLKIASETKGQR
jgi:actin-related protein